MLRTDLAREAGADMLGQGLHRLGVARRLRNSLENSREIADRNALGQQRLQHAQHGRGTDLPRNDVVEKLFRFVG